MGGICWIESTEATSLEKMSIEGMVRWQLEVDKLN
ncbi:hypothetical protein CCACVL1_21679 [Corchorus capsularis]|uniref:Uncharacterized protein n=1 Tax=Corchorus capsularis TaxID=210143 RepID=A0A1R3H2M9_COCAP|nr:hypothetical protein CCACVL1_21679 [Corchorus capsularis]